MSPFQSGLNQAVTQLEPFFYHSTRESIQESIWSDARSCIFISMSGQQHFRCFQLDRGTRRAWMRKSFPFENERLGNMDICMAWELQRSGFLSGEKKISEIGDKNGREQQRRDQIDKDGRRDSKLWQFSFCIAGAAT